MTCIALVYKWVKNLMGHIEKHMKQVQITVAFVPSPNCVNNGCVLECRDISASQVIIGLFFDPYTVYVSFVHFIKLPATTI